MVEIILNRLHKDLRNMMSMYIHKLRMRNVNDEFTYIYLICNRFDDIRGFVTLNNNNTCGLGIYNYRLERNSYIYNVRWVQSRELLLFKYAATMNVNY